MPEMAKMVTLEHWMQDNGLVDEDVSDLTKAIDPTGKGVCIRTVAYGRAKGVSQLRSIMLLCAVTGGAVHPWSFARTMFLADLSERAPAGFNPFQSQP